MQSRKDRWSTIATTLVALLVTFLFSGTALAQSATPGGSGGPPPVIFIVGVAGVFIGILVAFLIFAKSQGCDTNKEKKKEWN